MANQNILRFYGSKLDLKVDYSELYDFELSKVQMDYNEEVLNFDREITYTGLTIDSSCLTGITIPLEIEVNTPYTGGTCDFTVRRRTEKGWTLDFIFNGIVSGSTFYYLGIKDDFIDGNYADNNLSFSFTSDNRIKWKTYKYSGLCSSDSGYTETYQTITGSTNVMCVNDFVNDFNVTIVFDRYSYYNDCEIENEGGWNDLILGPHAVPFAVDPTTGNTAVSSTQITSGYTITNDIHDWVTGATITTQYIEELNKKWNNERQKRLGTLKIYLNGKPLYKVENFEEIIPSLRRSTNPIVQIFGNDSTDYTIKRILYYEEPLDFVHIKHHYKTLTESNYDIIPCDNTIYGQEGILQQDGSFIITNDGYILMFDY